MKHASNEVSTKLNMTQTLIGRANILAAEHEVFNDNYIIGGRRALYELLAKMLELVNAFDQAVDKKDLLEIIRLELLNKYGIKTNNETSSTALLVRYITRADRKKVHIYSRAIEAARLNQINSTQFIDFVEECGGIEAMRVGGVVNQQANKMEKKLELTKKYLQSRAVYPLASFKVSNKNSKNIPENKGLSLILCHEEQGRHYVIAGLPLEDKLNKKFLELFARNLPDDLSVINKQIEKFFYKAKQKRSKNKLKEIIRRRPEMANSFLRAHRIQQLTSAKNSLS